RGNVATRLQKLAEQDDLEALVLAAAGLKRLGLYEVDRRFQWLTLPVEVMLPAVGQGLLAVEVRAADTSLRECLAAVNDPVAAACGAAERAFLEAMGGGCQLPYAGLATVVGDDLLLTGAAFGAAGDESRRTSVRGTMADAVRLGQTAAAKLKG
ncbi:hydroxymethylbilane synthase, partial [bacterium]|nr:hydroxymethylbilane synthase [bacterium]